MVRRYAPKNRYCKNTKLSEEEFTSLVGLFYEGYGAAAAARKLGRSERSIRVMYERLRARLAEDAALTGWMGGGSDILPAEDDPLWDAIYECMAHCPAAIDSWVYSSPEYVSKYRGFDPDADHTQKSLAYTRKVRRVQCTRCPIDLKFEFDAKVLEEWGQHELRCGGIPKKHFKHHYFEIMWRANMWARNSKFPQAKSFTAQNILNRLEEAPL